MRLNGCRGLSREAESWVSGELEWLQWSKKVAELSL